MFNLNFLYLEKCYCKKVILISVKYPIKKCRWRIDKLQFHKPQLISKSLLKLFYFYKDIILPNISKYFSLINHNTCTFLLPGTKKSLKFNPCILLMYSQNCCNLHMHEQLMTYFINHFMLPKNLDPCTWFMHACSTKFSKGLSNVLLSITESLAKKMISYILSPNYFFV